MSEVEGHELRTFFNGPHDGTCWECWCGETSLDVQDEFIDQAMARHNHERHQVEAAAEWETNVSNR